MSIHGYLGAAPTFIGPALVLLTLFVLIRLQARQLRTQDCYDNRALWARTLVPLLVLASMAVLVYRLSMFI